MPIERTINQIRMTKEELFSLPEYSGTFPTGKLVGKMWRRNTTYGSPVYSPDGPWMIGEYVYGATPGVVRIQWKHVLLDTSKS